MFDNIKYLILVNVFIVFTTIAGNGLRCFFNIEFKEKKDVNLCISFFFGLIGIIFLFRTIGYFIDLKYAKYITIIIMIFIIIKYNKLNLLISTELKKNIWVYALFFCSLTILLPLYWHPIDNDINDNFSHIGSLHSVKYAWISNFIFTCNFIPILGQNTGQSLFVSLLNLLFGAKPFIYLSTLLIWAQFFLFILVFGFLKIYFDYCRSLAYAIIIFLGTSSLSLTHILVIDSGSPLLLNGYTDTLLGIFSIFIFYYLYRYINLWKSKDYLLYCVFLIANFLSSPQNILYILLINFLLIFLCYKTLFKKLLFINLITFIVCILGVSLGGMLTPKFLQVDFSSHVAQTLFSKSSSLGSGLQFIPGIPFYYGSMSSGWHFGNMDLLKAAQNILFEPNLKFASLIWMVESILLNSFRILAVPFLGVIFLIFHLNSKNFKFHFNNHDYFKFCFATILLFTIGFIICFFISLNGYKWELSRFIIPGYFFSYIAFCLFLEYLFIQRKISVLIFIIIIFLLVFGPLSDFLVTVFNNVKNFENLNNFLGNGPSIDKSSCSIK